MRLSSLVEAVILALFLVYEERLTFLVCFLRGDSLIVDVTFLK